MNVIKGSLDIRIKAFSTCSCEPDGDYYTIYVNDRLSADEQLKGYIHELKHIDKDDFHADKAVQQIEKEVREDAGI